MTKSNTEKMNDFFKMYLEGISVPEIIFQLGLTSVDVEYKIYNIGGKCLNVFRKSDIINPIFLFGFETRPYIQGERYYYCYATDKNGYVFAISSGNTSAAAYKEIGNEIKVNLEEDISVFKSLDYDNFYVVCKEGTNRKPIHFNIDHSLISLKMNRKFFRSSIKVKNNAAIFAFLYNCKRAGILNGLDLLIKTKDVYRFWEDKFKRNSKLIPKKSSHPIWPPLAPVSPVFLWGHPPINHAKTFTRPRFRWQCEGIPRPCIFASCKYNMYLKNFTNCGKDFKITFPNIDIWDMDPEASCCLDIADQGSHTLHEISEILNVTRERVRQIEGKALIKVKSRLKPIYQEYKND
jgi:hypothetical protein